MMRLSCKAPHPVLLGLRRPSRRMKSAALRPSMVHSSLQLPSGEEPLSPIKFSITTVLVCTAAALFLSLPSGGSATSASSTPSLLQAADLVKLVPATVFFRGQVASTQMRNAGGVKMSDGMLVLCVLVDTSGYSTGVQEKYQGYFITEVALDINGQTLKPGAYGVGFLPGNRFLVMDLGAHDLFTAGSAHDTELKRPTPLQVLADTAPGRYRLYINRNYVVFSRTSGQ